MQVWLQSGRMDKARRETKEQEKERLEFKVKRGTVIAPADIPKSGKETEQLKGRHRD